MDLQLPWTLPWLLLIITLCLLWKMWLNRNLPPGPTGLPIVGYVPFLGKRPDKTLLELGKKFGEIFTLNLGGKKVFVLSNYNATHAALINQADIFTVRGNSALSYHIGTKKGGRRSGILLAGGELWKTHRQFMLQTLKVLGVGKGIMESRILEENEQLLTAISQNTNQPYNPLPVFLRAGANVICGICFGKIYRHSDYRLGELIQNNSRLNSFFNKVSALGSYPLLRFLPPFHGQYCELVELIKKSASFVQDEIKSHESTSDKTEANDYIDAFLARQKYLQKSDPNGELGCFSKEDLLANVQILFMAGAESTKVTLSWLLLYMLHYSDVQAKVHQEIDEHIAANQTITTEHKAKLVYIEAVIREVQRMANIAPFTLRTTNKDTTLLGYKLPKMSTVMINYYAINRDPSLYANPDQFRPERFINSSGQLTVPPYFAPFGYGKRACIAESLARMELFIFFGNMMKMFELRPAPGYQLPSTEDRIIEFVCGPLPFYVEFRLRQAE